MTIDPFTDWKPYLLALGQRGLRGFFIFFVMIFALLLALGTWQLQRLEWKTALIADIQNNLNAPPLPLSEVMLDVLSHNQNPDYKKVTLTGTLDLSHPLKLLMQTRDIKGQSTLGYHLLYPCDLENSARILVDMGWVPVGIEPEALTDQWPVGPQSFLGVLKTSSGRTSHTPDNTPEKDEYFYIDPTSLAKEKGWSTLLPFYVIRIPQTAEATQTTTTYPLLTPPSLSIRNTHLEYAIIWYVLALFWGLIFVVYVRRFVKRRL